MISPGNTPSNLLSCHAVPCRAMPCHAVLTTLTLLGSLPVTSGRFAKRWWCNLDGDWTAFRSAGCRTSFLGELRGSGLLWHYTLW